MLDPDYSPFSEIDKKISNFVSNKNIRVEHKTYSDDIFFEYRKLIWALKGVNLFLEIFPKFDDQDSIISWNLISVAWYDFNGFRYSKDQIIKSTKNLEEMNIGLEENLNKGFNWLNSLDKKDIPKVLEFGAGPFGQPKSI